LPDFDIISFDLFNTLVHVKRPSSYDRKKEMYNLWTLMDDYSAELPFETFFKNYQSKLKIKFLEAAKGNYREKTVMEFLIEIFKDNGIARSTALDELARKMATDYFRGSLDHIFLFSSVNKLLERMKEEGYQIILTSDHSWAPNGHDLLKKFNIRKFFDKVTFSGEVGFRKPSEVIFEKAVEGLNLSSNDKFLHVGDDYFTDIQGVINFGGEAIWIDSWTDEQYRRMERKKPVITGAEKNKIRTIIPSIDSFPEAI